MARSLASKTNVTAPGGNYPYGRVKDNTGSGDGTHVDENLLGDLIQYFEKLMALGGVTANGLPENSSDGFQYLTALINLISSYVSTGVSSEAATRAAADTTLQNNINTEATNRASADTTLTNTKVAKAGDSMTGALAMGGNKITGLAAGTATGEAARYDELTSEASTRAAAVSAEASTRSAADTTLQNNINAIDDSLISWADTMSYGTNWASNAGTVGSRKVRGVAYLRGLVRKTSGSANDGDVAFTLPTGQRPLQALRVLLGPGGSLGGINYADIQTSGDVTIHEMGKSFGNAMTNTSFYLDGVYFDTAH